MCTEEIPQIPIPPVTINSNLTPVLKAAAISAPSPAGASFVSVATQCDEFYMLDDNVANLVVKVEPWSSASKPSYNENKDTLDLVVDQNNQSNTIEIINVDDQNEMQSLEFLEEQKEHEQEHNLGPGRPGISTSTGVQQLLLKHGYKEEAIEGEDLQKILESLSGSCNPEFLKWKNRNKKKKVQVESSLNTKSLEKSIQTKKYICKSKQLKLKFKKLELKSKKNAYSTLSVTAAKNVKNDDAVDIIEDSVDFDSGTDTRGKQPIVEISNEEKESAESKLTNPVVIASPSHSQVETDTLNKSKVKPKQPRRPRHRHNIKSLKSNLELDLGVTRNRDNDLEESAAAVADADSQELRGDAFYEMHYWIRYEGHKKIYECKVCREKIQDSTSRIRKLKDHVRGHKTPCNFNCKVCRKSFLNLSSVDRHNKTITHIRNLQALKYRKMINKKKNKQKED